MLEICIMMLGTSILLITRQKDKGMRSFFLNRKPSSLTISFINDFLYFIKFRDAFEVDGSYFGTSETFYFQ